MGDLSDGLQWKNSVEDYGGRPYLATSFGNFTGRLQWETLLGDFTGSL